MCLTCGSVRAAVSLGQRYQTPLELELKIVVSCHVLCWVLDQEANACDCWAISPAPDVTILNAQFPFLFQGFRYTITCEEDTRDTLNLSVYWKGLTLWRRLVVKQSRIDYFSLVQFSFLSSTRSMERKQRKTKQNKNKTTTNKQKTK